MRIDQLLVRQGLAPTRSAAQRLIERGAVRWRAGAGRWAVPEKAGADLPEGCEIQITDDAELRWASRGGLKLDAALRRCGLEVAGLACLDVGQGSGGFTDVLLAHGAAHVTGVDVGHDQLVARLCSDARVTAYQGLNARALSRADLGDAMPAAGYDMVVGDVSFISSALVWPALAPLIAPGGHLLWLIKPQFELQPAQIGKGGVVRSGEHGLYAQIEERLREAAAACGLLVLDWFDSAITGGGHGNQAGNREFFLHAARGGVPERQDHEST